MAPSDRFQALHLRDAYVLIRGDDCCELAIACFCMERAGLEKIFAPNPTRPCCILTTLLLESYCTMHACAHFRSSRGEGFQFESLAAARSCMLSLRMKAAKMTMPENTSRGPHRREPPRNLKLAFLSYHHVLQPLLRHFRFDHDTHQLTYTTLLGVFLKLERSCDLILAKHER